MNQVVIIFVPVGSAQRDFDAALLAHLGLMAASATLPEGKAAQISDNDQMALWTWFLPNAGRWR